MQQLLTNDYRQPNMPKTINMRGFNGIGKEVDMSWTKTSGGNS